MRARWKYGSPIVAGLFAALALSACGGSSKLGSATSSTTGASTTTEQVTTTLPVTTVAPTSPSTASRSGTMQQWASENLPRLRAMQTALQHMLDAVNAENLTALHDACTEMHSANEGMKLGMPTPDPQLTVALQSAIDDFDTAAHFCDQAVHQRDAGLMSQAGSYLTRAGEHLQEASRILGQYS